MNNKNFQLFISLFFFFFFKIGLSFMIIGNIQLDTSNFSKLNNEFIRNNKQNLFYSE